MTTHLLEATAVVTVTYNSSSHLRIFLESIPLSAGGPIRTTVADNASSDLASTRTVTDAAGATLLALEDNKGYGAAINAAVSTLPSQIEYILISNPDVELAPGSITTLLTELAGDPEVGSVGPRILNADGTTYPSGRELPSLRLGIGHALFAKVWPGNPWTRSYRAEREGADVKRSVGWLSGACLLVRRSAFDQLSGFDEGFFMYFEDVDLGHRLGKAGWKNVYVPEASVVHTGAHSTAGVAEKMLRAHHESAYRFLEKQYASPYQAPIRWVLKLGLGARAFLFARDARRH
jgi:N-acetylglucosaminyl-diphospho-decaprenol L-rhamnosyltransferase